MLFYCKFELRKANMSNSGSGILLTCTLTQLLMMIYINHCGFDQSQQSANATLHLKLMTAYFSIADRMFTE